MPFLGFMVAVHWDSCAKTALVNASQKRGGFGTTLWGTPGEGPGRLGRLFITRAVGKSYQELTLAGESAGCRPAHTLA